MHVLFVQWDRGSNYGGARTLDKQGDQTHSKLKQHSHKHSHMCTNPPLPHHFGLTSVSQLGRMVYLAYMQGQNAADKVKIMFWMWKSHQNLKHSTATSCPKIKSQLWLEMYTFLPKNICRTAKQLVEGCAEASFFGSGTVWQLEGKLETS